MKNQKFKVGDKVYCPEKGINVFTLQANQDDYNYPLMINSSETFTKNGIQWKERTLPSIIHATEENHTMLKKLYGVEFEAPPKQKEPKGVNEMAERELFYELGDVVEVMDLAYPCEITYIVADEEFDYEITAINDKSKVHFITENCINRKIGSNGWIRVDKRMPPYFVDVLVFNGYCIDIARTEKFHEGGEVVTAFENEDITHWQPMPKTPKEK